MTLREVASTAFVTLAVICAVVTTAITVRREFFATPTMGRGVTELGAPGGRPVSVANWKQYAVGGHRIGTGTAAVTIIEFAEFECPYCKSLALGPLRYIRQKYGDVVSVIFRQSPMPYHRFAYPAARAAECAAAQGRFEQFHDALFEGQDSLGLKSFDEFAAAAGVKNLSGFTACTKSTAPLPVVVEDIAASKALGIRGTPTFIVNGEMLVGVPDTLVLERLIKTALAKQ